MSGLQLLSDWLFPLPNKTRVTEVFCGSAGTRETNYFLWHFRSQALLVRGREEGIIYLRRHQSEEWDVLALKPRGGTGDGPHMKDSVELSASIKARPGWQDLFHIWSFGVSNSVFVCFPPAFVLIDDSWFACGCFFSSASLHVWCGKINGHKRRQSRRPSLDFFSVTAVVPILLMASYVSGHKEIPH